MRKTVRQFRLHCINQHIDVLVFALQCTRKACGGDHHDESSTGGHGRFRLAGSHARRRGRVAIFFQLFILRLRSTCGSGTITGSINGVPENCPHGCSATLEILISEDKDNYYGRVHCNDEPKQNPSLSTQPLYFIAGLSE